MPLPPRTGMLRAMSFPSSEQAADGSPVQCRHCGSAGTIRPNPDGGRRPLFSWYSATCSKAEHKATTESLAEATDDWWKQEKARRRAARGPADPGAPVSDREPLRLTLTTTRLVGLLLFLAVVAWLLAGSPTG